MKDASWLLGALARRKLAQHGFVLRKKRRAKRRRR